MHGKGPTEPQLQAVITGGRCVAKKKGTYRGHHLPWRKKRKKKKGEKRRRVPSTGIELANFDFIV